MIATLGRRTTERKITARGRRPPLVPMALATLFCAGLASAVTWQRATAALDAALSDRFSITQHVLSSEIGRLRHLPRVIAEDARLIAALASPAAPERVAAANDYLVTLRAATEAEEAYLIGADGVTIAASNWAEEGSFVGAHYGFRPYFRDAMAKGEGQYYAIGVTTGRPGVFLSARIGARSSDPAKNGAANSEAAAGAVTAGAVTGVAVVKVSLSALEQAWTRAGEIAAVTDADGVIFLSAQPNWRFRSLGPLTPETAARIAREQRYAGLGAGPPLALSGRELTEPGQGRLRLWQGAVRGTDWQLLVALPVAGLREQVVLIALIISTAGFLLSAFAYTIWQRRQILQLRLEEADRLELRVEERTRALAQEIEERRRTEAELRLAQENLVQATQLAVLGRMSAAIVHEVGQSLSALDNNLAVSELHGKSGAVERLEGALDRSRRMVRRLQGVVTRLRNFGIRQVPVETAPVALGAVIAVAGEIVGPRAAELSVALDLPAGALPPAMADAPRLEQVLSNLLLNAIEAAARGPAPPRVALDVIETTDVVLSIRDTGPGIPPERRRAVLEPFVADRPEGMGLGLYIVQNFLEQMGGRLELDDAEGGGTCARVHLPKAKVP